MKVSPLWCGKTWHRVSLVLYVASSLQMDAVGGGWAFGAFKVKVEGYGG